MKFTYEEPKPMRYEYRVIENDTGKVICAFQTEEDETPMKVELSLDPESSYRVEKHLVEPTPNEETT